MCLRCDYTLDGVACGGLSREQVLKIMKIYLTLVWIEYIGGIILAAVNISGGNWSAAGANVAGVVQNFGLHMILLVLAHVVSVINDRYSAADEVDMTNV